ncbi:DUF4179 domain-containing protein [Alkalibacillus salilacus]|uniref:DUF4179 domain-containing protein n=1 Tax=Alkalibacillus salilacus TaxID=284582 RepID=A0ABT9VG42_9BACI|nr:DUF4179 domain-containing protein [Alkalibacillus salilacus]MDQ0159936.1 hypothetical protein [Alkalibacillus salilacus]
MADLEKKLNDWANETIDEWPSDERLNQSIADGLKIKKKRHQRLKRTWRSTIVAAVVMFMFVLGVNTSPVFAEQVSKVPGFDHLVELVKWDKGRQAALSEGYYEEIDQSVKNGDVTLTIDGVIRDQYGMVVYHTIETEGPKEDLNFSDVTIKRQNGEGLPVSSLGFGMPSHGETSSYTHETEIFFNEPVKDTKFIIVGKVKGQDLNKSFKVSFEAENKAEPVHYNVDQPFQVGNEQYRISEVIINPLRTEVKVEAPENPDWALFNFEDLRLINGDGEVWASIRNGVVGNGSWRSNENDVFSVFLQSHYFEPTESLTLAFEELQAVPSENSYIELDLVNEEIVHDPLGQFESLEKSGNGFKMTIKDPEGRFGFGPFGQVYAENGDEIDGSGQYMQMEEEGRIFGKKLDQNVSLDMNPIKVELNYYPNWIQESTRIEIK